jgi:hypothetical protein
MKRIVTKKRNNVIQFDSIGCENVIDYISNMVGKPRCFVLGYRNDDFFVFVNLTRYTNVIRIQASCPQKAIEDMMEKHNMKLSDFMVFDSMKEAIEFANKHNNK